MNDLYGYNDKEKCMLESISNSVYRSFEKEKSGTFTGEILVSILSLIYIFVIKNGYSINYLFEDLISNEYVKFLIVIYILNTLIKLIIIFITLVISIIGYFFK
jgi:hypothetical protein